MYMHYLGNLHEFNSDGSITWSGTAFNIAGETPVVADDGTIYIPDSDGGFHALDQNGNHYLWEFGPGDLVCEYDPRFSDPAIATDGTRMLFLGLLFHTCNGKIYIFALKKMPIGL